MFHPGPPFVSCKAFFCWLLLDLGLEFLRQSQTGCCWLEAWSRLARGMELGSASKLGGTEPHVNRQGMENRVSQVDGVSVPAPACWICGSVGRRLRKGTMASVCPSGWEGYPAALSMIPETSVPPCMTLVPFTLLRQWY